MSGAIELTRQQRSVIATGGAKQVVARCAGRSRTVIVRISDGRLYYLSPGGLYSRCRG